MGHIHHARNRLHAVGKWVLALVECCGRKQVSKRSTHARPGMHMQQCPAVPHDHRYDTRVLPYNCSWGGGGGSAGGGGGGVMAAWPGGGGLRATHYYHMHTSRGCLGAWGYRGMYAVIAISRLCREESHRGLKD